jgi:hypothetical protein
MEKYPACSRMGGKGQAKGDVFCASKANFSTIRTAYATCAISILKKIPLPRDDG